mgnify:CR=1 FL=1
MHRHRSGSRRALLPSPGAGIRPDPRRAFGSSQNARTRLGMLDPRTGQGRLPGRPQGESVPMLISGFVADPRVGRDVLFTGSAILRARRRALPEARDQLLGDHLRCVRTIEKSFHLRRRRRARGRDGELPPKNSNIERLTLSGSPAPIPRGPASSRRTTEGDYRPIWSPDGSEDRVHTSTRTGYRSIWIANADGGSAREAHPGEIGLRVARLVPDGKTVSYSCSRTGNHEVCAAGHRRRTPPRRITTSTVFNGQASFTPAAAPRSSSRAPTACRNPILKRASLPDDDRRPSPART